MASIFKHKTTRYLDSDGRQVSSTTPGARRIVVESRKWYAKGIPGHPPGKRIPLANSRRVAEKMLADLMEKAERGLSGMATTLPQNHQLEPLVEEFRELLALKANPKHTKDVTRDIRRVLDGCKLTTVADLNVGDVVSRVEKFVWGLAKEMTAANAATIGKHARQFTRWLWIKKKLLGADPLAALDLPSNATVNPRRALTEGELGRLLHAARESQWVFRGLAGPDRALIYSVAVTTGFRVEEISALEARHFRLDDDPPMIMLPGTNTKNDEAAYQPISRHLAEPLRQRCLTHPRGPLWPWTWWERAARMLRRDLDAAGIPFKTDDGRADFHALRHTFTTILGRIAPPKVVQELARHSTPVLTVNRYSHAELREKSNAVDMIPLGEGSSQVDSTTLLEFFAAIGMSLVAPIVVPNLRTEAN